MNTSLSNDFQTLNEDGKLYAADSLNNLNKLKLCTGDSQDILQVEGKGTNMPHQESQTTRTKRSILILIILMILVTVMLSSCAFYFLVQMKYLSDEITQKLETQGRIMEELVRIKQLLNRNHASV
ncbi:leucine-rich single-pass membrane protein 1 [Xenopus laevis]|uniref:Leucine-rich single-pass membrane protein 1 n=2 Tax=Xenopus laevis TaxID=8355 RepID=A0A1L8GYS7_XENLA|nr:leucine-rich single-pass membrane protein 1 [Xenopus laevis]OCT88994.1 hypothetical protein XELAEV_18017623mg [Xenopus laevis]